MTTSLHEEKIAKALLYPSPVETDLFFYLHCMTSRQEQAPQK